MIEYYDAWNKSGIFYGGLVELIVNAMVDLKKPFIDLGVALMAGPAGNGEKTKREGVQA